MNPLSKEEFLEKLKKDKEFNNIYGRKHVSEGKMTLPPCHYGFQVYTRELTPQEWIDLMVKKHGMILEGGDETLPTRAISLMWNQRSVDTFLGLPFNIASYGLLLEIIAKEVNMIPDELIGNLGDTHLYSNHIKQAKEQIGRTLKLEERFELFLETVPADRSKYEHHCIPEVQLILCDHANIPTRTREPLPLPKLEHMKTQEFYNSLSDDQSLYSHLDNKDFKITGYKYHPAIEAPLSN